MQDFEVPGSFYLGRTQAEPDGKGAGELLLYDARHLTTHAVCVGMTGSGKTGLGIALLEEAALAGIPAIVVDPKGDMANLLLTFPELAPEDFAPWIDPAEAERRRIEPAELARATAEEWRKGLAEWGLDGARIARLRAAAEFTLYTPGSTAARPIRVLKSFAAPPEALRGDPEALNERVAGSVSGLLTLLGIDADPLQSREAILLSNIVQRAWSEGRDLDLEELIRAIQDPPFERLGVLDVDAFFPAKERFQLALALNNLLASPGFAAWLEGDALDAGALLWTKSGKPRVSILSIAHLSDTERMFIVTMLLNEVLAWVRTQPGTSSLRALVYMDEIFGFFPPTKEPPSKKPMLTLLKQARAFGLGIVLATQNPVDLDYKGLANTGTWFLGRLQTERDKLRVLDGLEGALRGAGRSFDRAELDALLSGLGKRVFLMHDVHAEHPRLFRTRWALSYLHGPLTRTQLRALSAAQGGPAPAPARATASATVPAAPSAAAPAPPAAAPPAAGGARPLLGPDVEERFARASEPLAPGERRLYRPVLQARARLHHVSARPRVDAWRELEVLVPLDADAGEPLWEEAEIVEDAPRLQHDTEPEKGAAFVQLPSEASQAKRWARWTKALADWLYRTAPLVLRTCELGELVSEPGEAEVAFRLRVERVVRETREREVALLREKNAPRLASARERVRKARERVGAQEEQLDQKKTEGWISIGSSILDALIGRKRASAASVGRASSTARAMGRTAREKADVERAERDLAAMEQKLAQLEEEIAHEVTEVEQRYHSSAITLAEERIAPRKSDLELSPPLCLWIPWTLAPDGAARRGAPGAEHLRR